MSRRSRPPDGLGESCVLVVLVLGGWLGVVWCFASFGWRTNNPWGIWLAILMVLVPIIGVLRENRRKNRRK